MTQPGNIFDGEPSRPEHLLETIQEKFSLFLSILDQNNRVLEVMGDMEEKAQGEYLFDVNYIRNCLDDIHGRVKSIIGSMIALGGDSYQVLQDRYDEVRAVVETVLPGRQPIKEDAFTVPFIKLNRTRALSVGSKNAQLGEMKSILELPVPEGFAITARAYKHFVDANNLQARITRRINSVNIRSYDELRRISDEICDMITSSAVPDDLSEQIMASYRDLAERSTTDKFSMRSSAIGEDTLFSFAGQYASYLNVCADELIDKYREILASKFTPKAIYYFLSHSLSEAELAMSVGCVSMVDAAASGVVYTRDPVNPEEDIVLVNSVYGLGKYLVGGVLTPDVFRMSRDGRLLEQSIADKPFRLVMHPDCGTLEEAVPTEEQSAPSLDEAYVRQLVEYAVRLENHYRRPQDIEWALDRSGKLFLLQSRPLRVVKTPARAVAPDMSGHTVIISGGTTVCPGAGSGPVYHVTRDEDFLAVPEGVALVAPNPFPGLVTIMGKINALVTRVGGLASHMATIAREYQIPTLVGVEKTEALLSGTVVTVDATGQVIYEGEHADLIDARRPEFEMQDTSGIYQVLERVLDLVSPLRLLHPTDDDFRAENCVTYHDITRFAHQKAMEEMFLSARKAEEMSAVGRKLKTDVPLDIHIMFFGGRGLPEPERPYVTEEDLTSLPLGPFWEGVKRQGWPTRPAPSGNMKRMGTELTNRERHHFSESSFAILTREYMILCLRMGYHFTTIEAMATEETSKNYIRMQYKDGGATLDRRIRRVNLLSEILSRMGFVYHHKSDYLHAIISYQDEQSIRNKLMLLGQLTIMAKQLDMALSNDAVTEWYTRDFLKKLGLKDMQ